MHFNKMYKLKLHVIYLIALIGLYDEVDYTLYLNTLFYFNNNSRQNQLQFNSKF